MFAFRLHRPVLYNLVQQAAWDQKESIDPKHSRRRQLIPRRTLLSLRQGPAYNPLQAHGLTIRTALLELSAMKISPSASTAMATGRYRPALMAGPPSPEYRPPMTVAWSEEAPAGPPSAEE